MITRDGFSKLLHGPGCSRAVMMVRMKRAIQSGLERSWQESISQFH
jgi:hypothetical protein